MNPANQVFIVGFLTDARKVGGEVSADDRVTHVDRRAVDRMATETAESLEQFLAVGGVSLLLSGNLRIKSRLPQERGDRLYLIVLETEGRHLCSRSKRLRIRQPNRDPVLVQFRFDLFQVRTDLLDILHQE